MVWASIAITVKCKLKVSPNLTVRVHETLVGFSDAWNRILIANGPRAKLLKHCQGVITRPEISTRACQLRRRPGFPDSIGWVSSPHCSRQTERREYLPGFRRRLPQPAQIARVLAAEFGRINGIGRDFIGGLPKLLFEGFQSRPSAIDRFFRRSLGRLRGFAKPVAQLSQGGLQTQLLI